MALRKGLADTSMIETRTPQNPIEASNLFSGEPPPSDFTVCRPAYAWTPDPSRKVNRWRDDGPLLHCIAFFDLRVISLCVATAIALAASLAFGAIDRMVDTYVASARAALRQKLAAHEDGP